MGTEQILIEEEYILNLFDGIDGHWVELDALDVDLEGVKVCLIVDFEDLDWVGGFAWCDTWRRRR